MASWLCIMSCSGLVLFVSGPDREPAFLPRGATTHLDAITGSLNVSGLFSGQGQEVRCLGDNASGVHADLCHGVSNRGLAWLPSLGVRTSFLSSGDLAGQRRNITTCLLRLQFQSDNSDAVTKMRAVHTVRTFFPFSFLPVERGPLRARRHAMVFKPL